MCVGCLFLTTACSDDDPEPLPSGECLRTVLVYMAADNSLSGLEQTDLNELKTGMAALGTPNVHLLVYIESGAKSGGICNQEWEGDRERYQNL